MTEKEKQFLRDKLEVYFQSDCDVHINVSTQKQDLNEYCLVTHNGLDNQIKLLRLCTSYVMHLYQKGDLPYCLLGNLMHALARLSEEPMYDLKKQGYWIAELCPEEWVKEMQNSCNNLDFPWDTLEND